jgi:hypothetical protein
VKLPRPVGDALALGERTAQPLGEVLVPDVLIQQTELVRQRLAQRRVVLLVELLGDFPRGDALRAVACAPSVEKSLPRSRVLARPLVELPRVGEEARDACGVQDAGERPGPRFEAAERRRVVRYGLALREPAAPYGKQRRKDARAVVPRPVLEVGMLKALGVSLPRPGDLGVQADPVASSAISRLSVRLLPVATHTAR